MKFTKKALKIFAINKSGETGCATIRGNRTPAISVRTSDGYTKYEGEIGCPDK